MQIVAPKFAQTFVIYISHHHCICVHYQAWLCDNPKHKDLLEMELRGPSKQSIRIKIISMGNAEVGKVSR